ncbi:Uncharacterised protein [Mycobacteroides abscessus subsp. abscessus]|nr:Uncharacterised protein [Mycobacteroides abscessus subsp. abscessus]
MRFVMRLPLFAIAAAAISGVAVVAAPVAGAQRCQSGQQCQGDVLRQSAGTPTSTQSGNVSPTQCRASLMNHMCAKPGNAQLQSWPNPAIIPPVPVTIPPWQVLGAPGEGRYP